MYKRILVAIDGSHTSTLALEESIKLAKELKAQLRILHIVEDIMPIGDTEFLNYAEIQEAVVRHGTIILQKAERAAKEAGVEAETRLVNPETPGQRAADTITQEADTWPANLVVIGTHGRHGFDRLLMGSIAEGVARKISKPLLLIRGK